MNEDKVENMLSQLIKMVGNIQSEQQDMKLAQEDMKLAQEDMKLVQKDMLNKLQELETKGEERHKEIKDRLKSLENDQDFIWEKTARNEREIAHIKRQLS